MACALSKSKYLTVCLYVAVVLKAADTASSLTILSQFFVCLLSLSCVCVRKKIFYVCACECCSPSPVSIGKFLELDISLCFVSCKCVQVHPRSRSQPVPVGGSICPPDSCMLVYFRVRVVSASIASPLVSDYNSVMPNAAASSKAVPGEPGPTSIL